MEIATAYTRKVMSDKKLKDYLNSFPGIDEKLEKVRHGIFPDLKYFTTASGYGEEVGILLSYPYGHPHPIIYKNFVFHARLYGETIFLYYLPAVLANFPFVREGHSREDFDRFYAEIFLVAVQRVLDNHLYMEYLRPAVFEVLMSSLHKRDELNPLILLSHAPDFIGVRRWSSWAIVDYFARAFLFLFDLYPDKRNQLLDLVGFDDRDNVSRLRLSLELLFYQLMMGWEPLDTVGAERLFSAVSIDGFHSIDWAGFVKIHPDFQTCIDAMHRIISNYAVWEEGEELADLPDILTWGYSNLDYILKASDGAIKQALYQAKMFE